MQKNNEIIKEYIFNDVLKYEQPTKYIVKDTNYDDKYKTPVLTAGKSFIIGYTNETTGICNSLPVIIFDDFTTSSQYVDFPFKVKSSAMKILHPTNNVDIKYLYYYMQTIQHKADTHKRYWISEYSQRKIYLPDIVIQKYIVSRIEEEFSKIDKGSKILKLVQEQMKQYRQSVLKDAFDGKLYKTTEWEENKIGDILSNNEYSIKRGPFGSSLKKEFFCSKGIRVFEQYNPINNDPYWSRYYISESKYEELKAFTASSGDLLISCSGTLGRIIELPRDVEKGIINQALLKITLNPDKILNSFFIYLFRSPGMQKEILDNTIGTAIQNIASVKELKKIKISLPSIDEQKQIVKEIEKRFKAADDTEKVIEECLEKAENLKKSLLKKAFEGRLVSQDPVDEPVSMLLEKIKKGNQQNA